MKTLIRFLVLTVAVLGLSVPGFAAEGATKVTNTIGGIRGPLSGDRSELTSGSAIRVTGITVTSGSSAGVLSLYDGDERSDSSTAVGKWEGGAPANESRYYDFTAAPLVFKLGLVSVTDGDEAGFVIHTES